MEVLTPGISGAEGKEKGKGVIARWGSEEAQSKSAGRRIPLKAGIRGVVDRRGEVSRGHSTLSVSKGKARTVEGKTPGGDKPGTASVKAEHCYPRGQGMNPDWHTG